MQGPRTAVLSLTLLLAAACGRGDSPVAPRTAAPPPAASLTSPTPIAGAVLGTFNCVAGLDAVTCVPENPGKSCWRSCVEVSAPLHDPRARIYRFNVRVRNRLTRSAIGTADGIRLQRGVSLVVLDGPNTVQGSGRVTVNDPRYRVWAHPTLPQDRLYSLWEEVVQLGQATTWRTWSFNLPATVKLFAFRLAVVAPVEAHVAITEIWAGKVTASGVQAGVMLELHNNGEMPITNATVAVQDSVHRSGAPMVTVTMPVIGEWSVGERRVVASSDLATVLPVPPQGTFPNRYVPDPSVAHTYRTLSGSGGKVRDRLLVPAKALPPDGRSRERFGSLMVTPTALNDPKMWKLSYIVVNVRCGTRAGCPYMFGTPGR